jgi:hypothetical protein
MADMQIISASFQALEISADPGKILAIQAIIRLIRHLPDARSMNLQPFRWLTIIKRCKLGLHKPHRREVSDSKGTQANLTEKVTISGRAIDKFMEIYAIIAVNR